MMACCFAEPRADVIKSSTVCSSSPTGKTIARATRLFSNTLKLLSYTVTAEGEGASRPLRSPVPAVLAVATVSLFPGAMDPLFRAAAQLSESDLKDALRHQHSNKTAHARTPSGGVPGGSVSPLLAACLAPVPDASPKRTRGAAGALRKQIVASILQAATSSGPPVGHMAPIGVVDGNKILGSALHAAVLGASQQPAEYEIVVGELLKHGADANAALRIEPDGEHWLNGATPLHLVALLGLSHGEAIMPVLDQLVQAGADTDRLLQGATALHIAVQRCESVPAHTVHQLLKKLFPKQNSSLGPAAANCYVLGLPAATPLQAACVAPKAALETATALLDLGAVSNSRPERARAVIAAMSACHRKVATKLLHLQASAVEKVPMDWACMTAADPALAPIPWGLTAPAATPRKALAPGTNTTESFNLVQWLLLAGAGLVHSELSLRALLALYQSALLSLSSPKFSLPDMPQLPPTGSLSEGSPECSGAYFLLTHCPLEFVPITLAHNLPLDDDATCIRNPRSHGDSEREWLSKSPVNALLRRGARGATLEDVGKLVHLVLSRGASPCAKDEDTGDEPVHVITPGFDSLYVLLKASGANITARNHAGESPLHVAARTGNVPLLRQLLLDAVDPNDTRTDGTTALHLALTLDDADVRLQAARSLVKNNASVTALDRQGRSPLDIARALPSGSEELVAFMEKQASVRSAYERRRSSAHSNSRPGEVAQSISRMLNDVAPPPPPAAPPAADTTAPASSSTAAPATTRFTAFAAAPALDADAPRPAGSAWARPGPGSGTPPRSPSMSSRPRTPVVPEPADPAHSKRGGAPSSNGQVEAPGTPAITPAFEHTDRASEADAALAKLSRGHLLELRSFARPSAAADAVVDAVCTLLDVQRGASTRTRRHQRSPSERWRMSVRALLAERDLIHRMRTFDKSAPATDALTRIDTAFAGADTEPAHLHDVSPAMHAFCLWVHAVLEHNSGRARCMLETARSLRSSAPSTTERTTTNHGATSSVTHESTSEQTSSRTSARTPPLGRRASNALSAAMRSSASTSPPQQPAYMAGTAASGAKRRGMSASSKSPSPTPGDPPFSSSRNGRALRNLASGSSLKSASIVTRTPSLEAPSTVPTLAAVTGADAGHAILSRIIDAGSLRSYRALVGEQRFKDTVLERLPGNQTLLHCLKDDQEQLLRPLLGLGLQINEADDEGNTPIHVAAAAGHAAVVRMLIMCNADPKVNNAHGQDALLCAVRSKQNTMAVVRTLMKFGMRADVKDASGKTALEIATQRAKGYALDPLLVYMTRTARVQSMQHKGAAVRKGKARRATKD